jgi:serine/threonine-protein kinase
VDQKLDRPVALKVIRPELIRSAEFAERFSREAKALARVLHPCLAVIYSFGDENGLYYMALELCDGEPLHEVIFQSTVLPFGRAAEIAAQVLDALEAIHATGIVHRDLKPPNILVATRHGRDYVKLVDFGLAKLREATGLTDPATLIGTPTYMSPEQAKGEKVDARSDIYSMSIVLYEMLTGAPPFEALRVHELLEKQARATPPPPSQRRRGMPADLEAVLLKGLAKKPEERFQSAAEYADALRCLLFPRTEVPPTAASPASPARGPEATPAV